MLSGCLGAILPGKAEPAGAGKVIANLQERRQRDKGTLCCWAQPKPASHPPLPTTPQPPPQAPQVTFCPQDTSTQWLTRPQPHPRKSKSPPEEVDRDGAREGTLHSVPLFSGNCCAPHISAAPGRTLLSVPGPGSGEAPPGGEVTPPA